MMWDLKWFPFLFDSAIILHRVETDFERLDRVLMQYCNADGVRTFPLSSGVLVRARLERGGPTTYQIDGEPRRVQPESPFSWFYRSTPVFSEDQNKVPAHLFLIQASEPTEGVWRIGFDNNPERYDPSVTQFIHWLVQRLQQDYPSCRRSSNNASEKPFDVALSKLMTFDKEIETRCFRVLHSDDTNPALWDSAVRTACIVLEERLREVGKISDANRIGRNLVNDIFSESGTLAQKFPVKAEREGYRDLYAGVVGVFRNQSAHKIVDPSPEDGAAFLTFVNLLLKMLESLR